MNFHGKLRVRVTTGGFALPVPDAEITIKTPEGRLIETLLTDISGLSPQVTLDAPPPEAQRDPELAVVPYARYTVEINAPGFLEAVIKGIQIYGDSVSDLPVDLEPETSENAGRIVEKDIDENTLLDRCCTQRGPGMMYANPYIHSQVLIPTTITVHLGTPASNARNVRVRFVDYIKNVASSEIFPDWPYHSLRANIHAQISLALNRIFTEWYPSRGYNFDITSSTQYDQYFVDGRNIFQEVSVIADEIFNTYVLRPPGTEPYFTEYCDGKKVSCPGMKQWGTVSLADQGMNYLQILRYYYGQNITVNTTDNIQSPFESFPGNLGVGAYGAGVATAQAQLARIRQNFPAMPPLGTVDGIFGVQTQAAVRSFQQIFSLAVTGVINRATWYKISYIYAAVKKLAELGSEGHPPVGPTPPIEPVPPTGSTPFPGEVLKLGSAGERVLLMQKYLNAAGRVYPDIPRQTEDGQFGPIMQSAVVAFQHLYNLTADGIIGRITWDKIVSVYSNLPTGAPPFPGTLLRQGMQNNDIKRMQTYLNAIGKKYPQIPQVEAAGAFGPLTHQAVLTFQRLFGLTADGVIGRITWDRIVREYENL